MPDSVIKEPLHRIEGGDYGGRPTFRLVAADGGVIAVTETLMLPSVVNELGDPLVLYVTAVDKGADTAATVVCLNAGMDNPSTTTLGDPGDRIVRMGRAAGELDVQTPQFEALPVKSSNYCQIFKAQVENSVLTRLSAKEVGWSLSDQEEVAIMDMRLGMEKSFLFGVKARLTDPKRYDEILFTEGIWNQAGNSFTYSEGGLDNKALVSMMRTAFTGDCSGSSRKVLMGGSGLIEQLNNLSFTKTIGAMDTVTRWGIDFTEIRSKFGTLYVVLNEVFDQCNHANDGLIIDPQYLAKYSHIPFKVEHLDLKSSGQRNCDALVATEASCLVLRHPKAHVKIIME